MNTRTALVFAATLLMLQARSIASSGTEGAAFLDIPVGAGPAALGSAYGAQAQDAYAPVYNPAGLAHLPGPVFAGQHLAYLAGMHHDYAGLVIPLAHNRSYLGHGLGLSVQHLGTGRVARTNLQGDPEGTYSSSYGAYSIAYGRALWDSMSLGLTGKWIRANLNQHIANAFAVDLGSQYQVQKWTLAATVHNIGTRLSFIQESDPLPLAAHLSAAWRPTSQLTLLTEGVYPKTGLAALRLGAAWAPLKMVELRAGYRTDDVKELSAMAGLSTGIGLKLFGQEFSYAWLPYGDLGSTQYFSLLLRFGAEDKSRWNLVQIPKHPMAASPDAQNILQWQDMDQALVQQLLEQHGDDVAHMPADPSTQTLEPMAFEEKK